MYKRVLMLEVRLANSQVGLVAKIIRQDTIFHFGDGKNAAKVSL
jgi:hypothetical protein